MASNRLIPPTRLPEALQHLANDSFQRGYQHLMEGLAGNQEALQKAIICQNAAMIIATPATWPELWLNARYARERALGLLQQTV